MVKDALKRHSADTRLVLATNATSRLDADLQQLGIQDLFFGIANSSKLNAVKPEKASYLAALKIANTDAKQAIYTDDDTKHVQMVKKIGIRSHHFTGIEGMSRFLGKSIRINQ